MSETDTTETDAEEFHEAITKDPVVDSSFARKLERERDEARREAEHWRDSAWVLENYVRAVPKMNLPWEKPDA